MDAQESILKIQAVKERGIVGFFVGSQAEARISRVLLYLLGEKGDSLSFLKAFEAPKGFEFVSMAACGRRFLSLLLVSNAESLVLTVEAVGSEQVRKTSFPVVIHDMTAVQQSSSNGALLRILVNGTSTEYFGIDSAGSSEVKPPVQFDVEKENSGAFLNKMCTLKDSQELVHNCIAFYLSLVHQNSANAVPSLGANYKALVKGYFLLDNGNFQEAFAHFCSPHIVADWEMDILRAFIGAGRSDLAYRYYIYSGRITFVALEERLLFIEMLIQTDNAIEALLQARLWSLSAEFVRILCANSTEKLGPFLEASVLLKAEEAAVLVNCLVQMNSQVMFAKALEFALRIGELECAKSISRHCQTPLSKLFVQLNGKPELTEKPGKSIEMSGELNAANANDNSESVVTAGMLSTPRAASKRPSEKLTSITNETMLQMPQFFSPKKKHTAAAAVTNEQRIVEEQLPLYRIDPSGKNKPAVSSTLAFSLMEDAEGDSVGEVPGSVKEIDELTGPLDIEICQTSEKQEKAKSVEEECVFEESGTKDVGQLEDHDEVELESDEIYSEEELEPQAGKTESEESVLQAEKPESGELEPQAEKINPEVLASQTGKNVSEESIEPHAESKESIEPQTENPAEEFTDSSDKNIQPQDLPHQTGPLKNIEQSSPQTGPMQSAPSTTSLPPSSSSTSNPKKPKKARRKRSLIQSPVLSSTSLQLPPPKVKPYLPVPAPKKQKKSSTQGGAQTPAKKPADKQEVSTPMSTRRTSNK